MVSRITAIFMAILVTTIWLLSINTTQAEDQKYVRWSKSSLPINVYIEKTSKVDGFKSTYPVAVAKAFRQWKIDTKGLVDFVIVSNPNDADIQFVWSTKMRKEDIMESPNGHSFVWGVTSIGNPTKITLVTKHPLNDNQSLSDNVIYMIALHEIGHSLGIWWHTTDPQDIMYPEFVVPSTTSSGTRLIANENMGVLSRRDIQNLIALYNNNNTVMLDKLTRGTHISMPAFNNSLIGNIETTGTAAASVATKTNKLNVDLGAALARLKKDPNSYEAYNNIGLVYFESQEYNSAVNAFKKALSINPTYSKAHFNLALTYVKAKNYSLAIQEYEKYIQLTPNSSNNDNVKKEIDRLRKISSN